VACVQHQNSSKLQQPWEELQTETTLLLFTPHFSPHKLASIQNCLKYVYTLGLTSVLSRL